jgi:hypothetical protein
MSGFAFDQYHTATHQGIFFGLHTVSNGNRAGTQSDILKDDFGDKRCAGNQEVREDEVGV